MNSRYIESNHEYTPAEYWTITVAVRMSSTSCRTLKAAKLAKRRYVSWKNVL